MLITFRNLLRRRRRTALTIGGIALGAATYMMLLTAGRGLLEMVQESISILGADVVVQQNGAVSAWTSVVPRNISDQLAMSSDVVGLSRAVVGNTRFLDAGYFIMWGVAADDRMLARLDIVDGKPITGGAQTAEMLVGVLAARQLGLATGHLVETRHRRFEVVGIYQTGRAIIDRGALIDLAVAQQLFNAGDGCNLVFLHLSTPDRAQAVAEEINRQHPEVTAHPVDEWADSYVQISEVQTYSRFLALVALVIAILGVSNVLHIAVSERTCELAILRAIGWSRWRTASLVLLEGAAVSLLGGLCGVPLAAAVLRVVGSVDLAGYTTAGLIPLVLPLDAAVEGVVVSVLAGAIGSLAPLVRALRLQPARALRAL
jgi:putative ABC transport system permease protein